MSLRKGLCPYCGSFKNIKDNCFLVNLDIRTMHCPKCGKKIQTGDAAENFNRVIENLNNKANYLLFVKRDTQRAYMTFGELVGLNPEDCDARYGRILSLLYSSRIHKSMIKEVETLMDNESAAIFRKSKDKEAYVKFLIRANYIIDEYIARIRKNVTLKKCFYDEDCLKVYFERVYEAVNFEKILLNEGEMLNKHYSSAKLETLINFLKRDIYERNDILGFPYRTVDGKQYRIHKIYSDGEVQLEEFGEQIATNLHRYRMATFDITNKSLRHIDENVFKNVTNKIILCNWSMVFIILFSIAGIAGITASLLLKESQLLFISCLVAGCVCIAIAVTFVIIFIQLITFINKRKKKIYL